MVLFKDRRCDIDAAVVFNNRGGEAKIALADEQYTFPWVERYRRFLLLVLLLVFLLSSWLYSACGR